jgi:hypothetical protein
MENEAFEQFEKNDLKNEPTAKQTQQMPHTNKPSAKQQRSSNESTLSSSNLAGARLKSSSVGANDSLVRLREMRGFFQVIR